RIVQCVRIPLLVRRGGCGITKKSRSHQSAAAGVVAHTQMFQNAFRNVTCERPPRPRLFGTGPFLDGAATPPWQGGEYAATKAGLVLPEWPLRSIRTFFGYNHHHAIHQWSPIPSDSRTDECAGSCAARH